MTNTIGSTLYSMISGANSNCYGYRPSVPVLGWSWLLLEVITYNIAAKSRTNKEIWMYINDLMLWLSSSWFCCMSSILAVTFPKFGSTSGDEYSADPFFTTSPIGAHRKWIWLPFGTLVAWKNVKDQPLTTKNKQEAIMQIHYKRLIRPHFCII